MITSRQKINKDIKHLNNAPPTWPDICTYGIGAPPKDGHVRSSEQWHYREQEALQMRSCWGLSDGEIIPDYRGGPNVPKSPYKKVTVKSRRCEEERFKDATPMALRMEERDTSQRIRAASRSWEGEGTDSAPQPSEECSPASSFWTSDLCNCKTVNVLF